MRIAGLDLSLNRTGAVSIDTASGRVVVKAFEHKNLAGHERLQFNAKQVGEFVADHDLAVIEGLSFMSKTPMRDVIEANHWMGRHECWKRRVPYAIVTPTQLKLYVTMNGAAKKAEMLTAIRSAFPTLTFKKDDEADAMGLATMGLAYRGLPVDMHVSRGRSVLAEIEWPDHRGEPSARITRRPHPTREAFSPVRGVSPEEPV